MELVNKSFVAGPVIGMDTAIVVDPDESKSKASLGIRAFKEISELSQSCENDHKKLLKLIYKLISTSKGYKAVCMDEHSSYIGAESRLSPILLYIMGGGFVPTTSKTYSDVNRLNLKLGNDVRQAVTLPSLNLFHLLLRGYTLRPNEECLKDVFLPRRGAITGCIHLICKDIGGPRAEAILKKNKYVVSYSFELVVCIVVRLAACLISKVAVESSSESEDSGYKGVSETTRRGGSDVAGSSTVQVPGEGSMTIDISNIYRNSMDNNGVSIAIANNSLMKKSNVKFNRFLIVLAEISALTYMLKFAAAAVDVIFVAIDPMTVTDADVIACINETGATSIFLDEPGAAVLSKTLKNYGNGSLNLCLFDDDIAFEQFNGTKYGLVTLLIENLLPSNSLTATINILKWRCDMDYSYLTVHGDMLKIVSIPMEYEPDTKSYTYSLSYLSSIGGFAQLAVPLSNTRLVSKGAVTARQYSKNYQNSISSARTKDVTSINRINMGLNTDDVIIISKLSSASCNWGSSMIVGLCLVCLGGTVALMSTSRMYSLQGMEIDLHINRMDTKKSLPSDALFTTDKTTANVSMSILRDIYSKIRPTILVMDSAELSLIVSWILCNTRYEGITRSVRSSNFNKKRKRDTLNLKNIFYRRVVESMKSFGCRELFERVRLSILVHSLNSPPHIHHTTYDIYKYISGSLLVVCAYEPHFGICLATPDIRSNYGGHVHCTEGAMAHKYREVTDSVPMPQKWTLQSMLLPGYVINPAYKLVHRKHDIVEIEKMTKTNGEKAYWYALKKIGISSRLTGVEVTGDQAAIVSYDEGIYDRIYLDLCTETTARASVYNEILTNFVETHCIVPSFFINSLVVEQVPGVDIQCTLKITMTIFRKDCEEGKAHLAKLRANSYLSHTALVVPYQENNWMEALEDSNQVLGDLCLSHVNEVLTRFDMRHLIVGKFDVV